jgi:hypothetical protein
MDNQYPQRKNMRHPDFNYSYPGMCFLTICTKEKKCILSKIVKSDSDSVPKVILTNFGRVADKYGFAAGLRVRWLPKAEGRRRIEVPHDELCDGWQWYDIGDFNFSALQKIPLPTMDGLCLFVQGDVELDKVEIARR